MRRLLIISLALALPAMAQDDEQRDRGDRGDRQERVQRRDRGDRQERGRGREGRGFGGERRGGVDRMAQRLVESLDLDDQQREQFEEILAGQRERNEEMGQIWREIREANQDGDEQRAAELREELRAQGGQRRGNPMTGILDELKPILRDDQMEAFEQLRERMGNMGGQGRGRNRGVENLIERLDLTEEQQREWDGIKSEQRDQGRNRWEEIRPLMEEMREARESGDDERLAEIRAKFAEMRGGNRGGGNDARLEALEKILDDDQKRMLEEYREQAGRRGGRDERNRAPDVRSIIQTAKRLDLSRDQKEELRDIEQEAGREQRAVRRDRQAAAALAETVKRDIMELLDDDQKRDFERQLNRAGRRTGRRSDDRREDGRRNRDDRRRRGSDDP